MNKQNAKYFFIKTLGCKLNYAETSFIINKLNSENIHHSKKSSDADIIIVNSCAVTSVAEKKTRQTINKLLRENPDAKFIITGCMADVNEVELHSLFKNNNYEIVKNAEKKNILKYVKNEVTTAIDTATPFFSAYNFEGRTRSFLKIQDGCNNFCTYCTVPYARGRSISNSIAGVISDIEDIISKGFKEIVLTGVNIGTFGEANNESLYALLKEIDSKFSGIRVRIGSTEPDLLTEEIIELISSSKIIMPHFHLPLQSGCDSILTKMQRHYSTSFYRNVTELIKKRIPKACIAADLIIGFPGEYESEFNQTYSFIENTKIDFIHVFPYSNRPLAKASKYDNQINPIEIRKRMNSLLLLGERKKLSFFKENLNSTQQLLVEGTSKNNLKFGFTNNYIKCAIPANSAKENEIINIKLNKIPSTNDYVLSSIC